MNATTAGGRVRPFLMSLLPAALAAWFGLAGCTPIEGSKPTIKYSVVEQWTIPNGGFGRIIVVDPAQRSEAGLLALADQLQRDTEGDRNAFITVYDDSNAASLRAPALAERLSQTEQKLHDDHWIGIYIRNGNTGFHAMSIALQGLNGPMKEVPLR